MERDPRLEHPANSSCMADDFSEQDNSGITVGNLLPDPEMATAATCARTGRGSKAHCPNNIYIGVERLPAKQVVWISGGLQRCREPLYCPPQRLFEPLSRSVKSSRAPPAERRVSPSQLSGRAR
jgi:hypothetical protein